MAGEKTIRRVFEVKVEYTQRKEFFGVGWGDEDKERQSREGGGREGKRKVTLITRLGR